MARRKNTAVIKETSLISFKGASILGTSIKLVSKTSLIIFGKERSTGNYISKFLLLVIVMSVMAMLALFIYSSTKWYLNDFCDAMTENLHLYDLQLFQVFFDKHVSHGGRNSVSIFMSNTIVVLYFSVLIIAPVIIGKKSNWRYWTAFVVVTLSSLAWNAKVMSLNQEIKYSSKYKNIKDNKNIAYIDIDSIHHVTVLDIDKEIIEKQKKISTHETLLAGKNEVKRKADVRNYNKKGRSQKNFDDAKYESELEELTIRALVIELGTLRTGRKETIHNLNVINSKKKEEYQSGLSMESIMGYIEGFGMDGALIILSGFCAFIMSDLRVQDTSQVNLNTSGTVKYLGDGIKGLTSGVTRLDGIKTGLSGIKSKYSEIKLGLSKIKVNPSKIKSRKEEIKPKAESSLFASNKVEMSDAKKSELINLLKKDSKYGEWHYSFMELLGSRTKKGSENTCWIDGNVYNVKETHVIIADNLPKNVTYFAVKSHYTNKYLSLLNSLDALELNMYYIDAISKREGAMSV